jgi:pimeloyl-ACP methyl ester carboxylesterase
MWKNIAPHFIETHTVLIIDLPGFGKSAVLGEIHTMELLAQLTAEVLMAEAIAVATIIGHSMGGYVALALAETHPQLVKTLVLLNSSPIADSADRKINRNRALAIIDKNKDAFVSMAISNLFTEKEQTLFSSEILKLKEEALLIKPEAIKAAIIGMRDRKNRTTVLKRFSGDKILICGTEDAIAPITELLKISEETNSTLHKIIGGHMIWATNTNKITQAVRFVE